ncbi:MAG TPA: GTPase, partial [Lautropia sp.]|nr:GTPase [Lautropia sp.]
MRHSRRGSRMPEAAPDQPVPVIALVGRPNVGKSTLFNRLTRSRQAIVADIPGLTRDRHYARCTHGDRRFVLIDTGGFEPVAATGVTAQMARQTRQAIIEADLVVFVLDGRQGMTPRDQDIANELRRSARLVRVAVNKTEGMSQAIASAEFHALGLGVPLSISSAHGEGVAELIDECLDAVDQALEQASLDSPEDLAQAAADLPHASAHLPRALEGDVQLAADASRAGSDARSLDAGADATSHSKGKPPGAPADGDSALEADEAAEAEVAPEATAASRPIRVAVVGRPNSGKSTLINALLGEERLIAFDTPGTTRDSIAVDFEFEKRRY